MATITLARGRRLSLALPRLDGAGLLTGVVYLVFFGFGFLSFTDPDYFWHLRTGQYIVQSHAIPREDIFSYSVLGKHWLTHEWLSEVLIYVSVSRLGYAVTLGLFVIMTLVSFALMQKLLLRIGTPPVAAALLIVLGLLISALYWTVRPQVISWAFTALFVSVLFERRKPAWALVPLLVLWTNLHLEFVLGLAVVGLWFVARLWERQADKVEFDWQAGGLFVLACAAATLVNPFGPELPLHALPAAPFVGGRSDLSTISEWASPNFHEGIHAPLLLGIVVLLTLSMLGGVRDRFAFLLAITFTVLALYSSRFQPLFAVAFLPAAGLAARDLALFAKGRDTQVRPLINWALVALTAVAVVMTLPQLPQTQLHSDPRVDGANIYPQASLRWLQHNQPDANVFANYTWGGYMLNGLYPQGHVFIDGRSEMYGDKVMNDYRTIQGAKTGWQTVLADSGTNAVAVSPSTRIAFELRYTPGWRVVFETKTESLFVKTQ